jgi:hypothetical protein
VVFADMFTKPSSLAFSHLSNEIAVLLELLRPKIVTLLPDSQFAGVPGWNKTFAKPLVFKQEVCRFTFSISVFACPVTPMNRKAITNKKTTVVIMNSIQV